MDWEETSTSGEETAREEADSTEETVEEQEPESAAQREAREKREEEERQERAKKTQTDPSFCHAPCRGGYQYNHACSAL